MAAMHFTTIANLTQHIEHKNSDMFLMFFLVLKTFCMVGLKACDFFCGVLQIMDKCTSRHHFFPPKITTVYFVQHTWNMAFFLGILPLSIYLLTHFLFLMYPHLSTTFPCFNSCYFSYRRFDIQTRRKGQFFFVLTRSPDLYAFRKTNI